MPYLLTIAGMSCDHCVRRATKALTGIDGVSVTRVTVGRAEIEAADAAAVARAVAALGAVGYAAEVSS